MKRPDKREFEGHRLPEAQESLINELYALRAQLAAEVSRSDKLVHVCERILACGPTYGRPAERTIEMLKEALANYAKKEDPGEHDDPLLCVHGVHGRENCFKCEPDPHKKSESVS